MITNDPKEYEDLIKKNLKEEHVIAKYFRELNILLTSSDIELINKMNLFIKLMNSIKQTKEKEKQIMTFMKETSRTLYIELLIDFDRMGYYQLLVKEGLIKNEKVLIMEFEKMEKNE